MRSARQVKQRRRPNQYSIRTVFGDLPITRSLLTFLSAALATLALTTLSYGQRTPLAQNAAPQKSKAAGPVNMTECEGTNNCATWTFLGTQGNGQWPSGEVANLSVERFDADSVVIRRADSTGSSAGLTAVYTGTRHGDRLGGEFTSSWAGHWTSKTGNWYATIGKATQGPPSVMHWCAQHCSTLVWAGTRYVGAGTVHPEATPNCGLTVESFTRDSVIMHRTDCGQYPGTAVLTGKISPQGNTIVNGTITWTYHPCCGLGTGVFQHAAGKCDRYHPGKRRPATRNRFAAGCLLSVVLRDRLQPIGKPPAFTSTAVRRSICPCGHPGDREEAFRHRASRRGSCGYRTWCRVPSGRVRAVHET